MILLLPDVLRFNLSNLVLFKLLDIDVALSVIEEPDLNTLDISLEFAGSMIMGTFKATFCSSLFVDVCRHPK